MEPGVEGFQPKEAPVTRRHDLQANLLSVSNGEYTDTSKTALHGKLQKTTEDRWDWKSFQQMSVNERQQAQAENKAISPQQWKEKFKGWVAKLNQNSKFEKIKPRLNSILSAVGLNDPSNITDEALDRLLQKYAYDKNGIKSFVLDIANNLPPDDFEAKLPLIKNLASRFFGKEVSGLVVAQIVDLESQIKLTGTESAKLDDLASKLSEAAKNPSESTKGLLAKIKELFNIKTEDQQELGKLKEHQENSDRVGGYSDPGTDLKNHPNQEDRYGIHTDDKKVIGVVADGVTFGGGGDVSAENAVNKIIDSLSTDEEFNRYNFEDAIKKAKETNQQGDTTVAIGIIGNDGVLRHANVGDTNVYVFSENNLTQVSMADQLSGENDNVITQSLNNYSDIHYGEHVVPKGGIVLILSDGVYKALNNLEIHQIITGNKDKSPEEISKALVNAAKQKGTENATAVVLKRD